MDHIARWGKINAGNGLLSGSRQSKMFSKSTHSDLVSYQCGFDGAVTKTARTAVETRLEAPSHLLRVLLRSRTFKERSPA